MEKIFETIKVTNSEEGSKDELIEQNKEEMDRLRQKDEALTRELSLISQQMSKIRKMKDIINESYLENSLKEEILKQKIKLIADPTDEYARKSISKKIKQLEGDRDRRTGLDKVKEYEEAIKDLSPEEEDIKISMEEDLKRQKERHKKLLLEKKETEKNLDQWRKQNEASLSE